MRGKTTRLQKREIERRRTGSRAEIWSWAGGSGGSRRPSYLRMKLKDTGHTSSLSPTGDYLPVQAQQPSTFPWSFHPKKLKVGLERLTPVVEQRSRCISYRVREADPDVKKVSTEHRDLSDDFSG